MKHNSMVLEQWLQRMKQVESATLLWSGNYRDEFGLFQGLCAWGEMEVLSQWQALRQQDDRLKIVSLSYDLKNVIEPSLTSNNSDVFGRPNLEVVVPEQWEILQADGQLISEVSDFKQSLQNRKNKRKEQTIGAPWVEAWDGKVEKSDSPNLGDSNLEALPKVSWKSKSADHIQWNTHQTEAAYSETIDWIKSKIKAGDFYEMNYCISFEANAEIDPYWVFFVMTQVASAPMMTFVKRGNYFLLSSSMERFLQRSGNLLLSQPIKGTIKNSSQDNSVELQRLAEELFQSEKDRAENVMIVDLVRNDLSRICRPGSVKVMELCGIYAFAHVLQMVSTVIGEIQEGVDFSEIIKATFPMGSMTGAPKIAVMQECESIEQFKRGMYSGSVGWWCGDDFDLNVIIRALQYDASSMKIQYAVGGAITIDSDPELEYKECMTKAEAMLKTLEKAGYSISNL